VGVSGTRRWRVAVEDDLYLMELNLHPNEASGLLTMGDETLLEKHGWDLGFWVVLDEGEIEDCVAAIGHRRGSPENEGWEIERLRASVDGNSGRTEDAEAITLDRDTGYVYILGSHFGGKAGPCNPNAASSPALARPMSGKSRKTPPCGWRSPAGASPYTGLSTTR
jgi:hypothetical protein